MLNRKTIFYINSNRISCFKVIIRCTTITLGIKKQWPLLTSGCSSHVVFYYWKFEMEPQNGDILFSNRQSVSSNLNNRVDCSQKQVLFKFKIYNLYWIFVSFKVQRQLLICQNKSSNQNSPVDCWDLLWNAVENDPIAWGDFLWWSNHLFWL